MTRMVCLGDSFTEGMSDDVRPDGHYLGWADRTAAALAVADHPTCPAPIDYANLAVRGKLLDQVVAEQIDAALALRPDLITFHAGANDVLRPGTSLDDLRRRYAAAVDRLTANGATVVLFTSLTRAGGSGLVADRIAARFQEFNAGIRRTADRLGCLLVDNEPVAAFADRRLWSVDRLHLNAAGHRRVAAHVLETLGVTADSLLGGPAGWWREPLPQQQRSKREDAAADAAWVWQYFLPWLGRRLRGVSSGDGLTAKDLQPRPVVPAEVSAGMSAPGPVGR